MYFRAARCLKIHIYSKSFFSLTRMLNQFVELCTKFKMVFSNIHLKTKQSLTENVNFLQQNFTHKTTKFLALFNSIIKDSENNTKNISNVGFSSVFTLWYFVCYFTNSSWFCVLLRHKKNINVQSTVKKMS